MARSFIPLNILSRFVRELLEEHFAKTEKANAVGQGQEINP